MAAIQHESPKWFTKRRVRASLLGGGVGLATLAFAACVIFGNILGVLMKHTGLWVLVTVPLLALVSVILRWAAQRIIAKRRGPAVVGIPVMTAVRVHFFLSLLVALSILGIGWVFGAVGRSVLQVPLGHAFLLTSVGWIFLVSLPLMALDNLFAVASMLQHKRWRPKPERPAT